MQRASVRGDLLRSLVLLLAFAAANAGLHTILVGLGWWWLGILLGIVVLGSSAAARGLLRPRSTLLGRILAPMGAAVALVVTLTIVFASDTALWGFVPTAESVDRFQKLLRDSGYSITWQSVPATADVGITCLLAIGIGTLILIADLCTFSLRLPALTGIPLAAIFLVPSLAPSGVTDGFWFAVTAGLYLLLLTIGGSRRAVPALLIGTGAIIVGLVLPAALPTTALALTTSGLGPSVSTGVNPIISLGNDLRQGQEVTVLSYSTVSGDPEPLRLVTLRNFTGTNWSPDEPALEPNNRLARLGLPPGLSPEVATTNEVSYFHIANLKSPWLPVPYPSTKITGLTGNWLWEPNDLTVASNNSLARGENYTVSSILVNPTPEQLQSAGAAIPAGFSSYLALPGAMPPIIAATAERVVAAATSNYQKAVALQEFFRSGDFSYSEQTPVSDGYDGTGMAVIAKFLQVKSGYCTHFAAAMAVMARTLGIPSRIAVGFQSGTLQSDKDAGRNLFAVTTHDLHAWPELYFDGIGWVRFEPTPTRGTVPDYANQALPGVPVSPSSLASNPSRNGQAVPLNGSIPKTDAGPTVAGWLSSGNGSGWLVLIGAIIALLVLSLLPAGIRFSRRHRTLGMLRKGAGNAILAWSEVIDTARDVGIVVGVALTPRTVVERLARARGMTAEGRDALSRLSLAVEREAFGPSCGETHENRAVGSSHADDLHRVVACLMTGADGRMRAILLPPSLLSRFGSGRLA